MPPIEVEEVETEENQEDKEIVFDKNINYALFQSNKIKLQCSDSKDIYYSLNGSEFLQYSNPFALSVGNNTIECYYVINDEKSDIQTIDISIKKPTAKLKNSTLKVNKKTTVTVSKESLNASVTYKSSNKKIATVSKYGTVTGKKKGNATITVTIKQNGETFSYKLKLKIK